MNDSTLQRKMNACMTIWKQSLLRVITTLTVLTIVPTYGRKITTFKRNRFNYFNWLNTLQR